MGLALVPFFDAGFNIDHKTMADDFNDKIVYSAGLELRWRSPGLWLSPVQGLRRRA